MTSPRSTSLPLVGYLCALGVSLTGTRVSMIAVPWLVLTTTGSAGRTGLVAFAETAPLVLCQAGLGPVIDRLGPRRVSIVCDVASVGAVGLVPVLHLLGGLGFGALLALMALAGALRGPSESAKQAFLPVLADHAGVPFERVTGLAGAVERSATFAGAAAAGGLVAWLGVVDALLVDALSFGVCALLLGVTTLGVGAWSSGPAGRPAQRASYLREWREGWRFLRRDPVLVSITAMLALTNLLDTAFTAVLLPVWAHDRGLGVGAVGAYAAVWAAASAVGALLATWLAERLPRFRVYVVAFLVTGLPRFLVLALGLPLPAVLAMAVVGGLMSGFLNPILGAVVFERVPRPVLGRVSSLTTAMCWSLMPFGGVVAGVLVTVGGVGPALVVSGVAYLLVTMMPLVLRSFRSFDRADPDPEQKSRKVGAPPRVSAGSGSEEHLPSSSTRG